MSPKINTASGPSIEGVTQNTPEGVEPQVFDQGRFTDSISAQAGPLQAPFRSSNAVVITSFEQLDQLVEDSKSGDQYLIEIRIEEGDDTQSAGTSSSASSVNKKTTPEEPVTKSETQSPVPTTEKSSSKAQMASSSAGSTAGGPNKAKGK